MFLVFGVTRDVAKKTARKKCTLVEGFGKNMIQLTQAQYEQKVDALTLSLYKSMKPVKLSHSLSSPTRAKEFLKLVQQQAECRDLTIRYRKPTGKFNPKTKKPMMAMTIYQGEML